MSFSKHTATYGRRQAETKSASPYDRAKREWDDRIGSARVQAFHWRLVAMLSITGMFGLGIALVYVSVRKDIKTFVVEVNELGKPARVKLIGDRYEPDDAQAGYFIGQLVSLVRTRPLDPVVIRDNWKKAYGFLAGDAIHTMNAYAAEDPPLRSVDGRRLTRIVAITNVLQKSDETYQVRWVETDYAGGVPQRPNQFTGLFQIELKPPRSETDVFRNPLGIYVTSFSWSKEFTEGITTSTPSVSESSATTNQEPKHESNEE